MLTNKRTESHQQLQTQDRKACTWNMLRQRKIQNVRFKRTGRLCKRRRWLWCITWSRQEVQSKYSAQQFESPCGNTRQRGYREVRPRMCITFMVRPKVRPRTYTDSWVDCRVQDCHFWSEQSNDEWQGYGTENAQFQKRDEREVYAADNKSKI